MKVLVLLPVAIIMSVALVAVMKIRGTEHSMVYRQHKFQSIKLRVTHDVLAEYQNEKTNAMILVEQLKPVSEALMQEVTALQAKNNQKKEEVNNCQGAQKSASDELSLVEKALSDLQAESSKEKDRWNTELATLKQQLQTRSKLCDFLKTENEIYRKWCGEVLVEAPKPEVPKAEAPKPEEPKAEAPKAEEPKAEAPKPEEPKAEAPKAEMPKADAPKPEEPKAEAPKPEEPKAEAPKPEEPKAEAPKPEEPKAEAPKPEEPKAEAPKAEEPKAEAPKAEEPKAEAPKP
ncbi:hypothetical protein PAMA_015154 [Pampus argenteus]